MKNLENYIETERPDVMLTLGDTNSALSGLIAKRYGVLTYHIEAGNRSFDSNVPEEVNRKIIDHFSDFNLAYSTNAYNNLLREGLHPRSLLQCGSPMYEVLKKHEGKIKKSKILNQLKITKNNYFLVSVHRQENIDNIARLKQLWETLEEIARKYNKPCLISLHPRTKNLLDKAQITSSSNIIFHEPFGFIDYCALQVNAFCVLSDSGTISEESTILGFNAVTLRDSIERSEALDSGSIMLAGLTAPETIRAIEITSKFGNRISTPEAYLVPDHSLRVVRFIQSTASRGHSWFGYRERD